MQSKVLRIIFDCKRSGDAWIHNNNQIDNIQDLYYDVIKKLCTKHHAELLPCKFAKSVMPEFYAVQLQNRVTGISLDQMYNYKDTPLSTDTPFKANCVKTWNNMPFDYKTLPYSSNKEGLFKLIKAKK